MFAMMPACATLPDERPAVEHDPVILTNSKVEKVCPHELLLEVPGRPATPAGAIVKANELALGWLRDLGSYVTLIETRLIDAAGECPK
ncbi:hypothetical protein [Sphingorhabdus sp. 109]|uniref:hypothetical protein n=1 Tax=Sphingorhabdus sp. 109 TaxID=2653173 RepID=UPI001358DEBD|nr:hypothetical protein [Sphingorhabdus sp. 109]